MINESYAYIDIKNKTHYVFQSEGQNGKILKAVVFTNLGERLWNLGFGDLQNGDIDDAIVSNNHDLVKVISTVAKIANEFSNNFPLRHIVINPIDAKRKRLYNHVFRRHYEVISTNFSIIGINKRKKETYSPQKIYDSFELIRKFGK